MKRFLRNLPFRVDDPETIVYCQGMNIHTNTTFAAANKAADDALAAYETESDSVTLAAYDKAVRAVSVARRSAHAQFVAAEVAYELDPTPTNFDTKVKAEVFKINMVLAAGGRS